MHRLNHQSVTQFMKWSAALTSELGLNFMQMLARTLFALLALLYYLRDDSPLQIQPVLCWALLAGYLLIQLVLLFWHATARRFVSHFIDLAAITALVIVDPQPTPPTLLLFLVFTLSGGVLFGLRTFLAMLVVSALAITAALPLHDNLHQLPLWSYSSLFLIAILALCALYFLLLLGRNQLLLAQASKAAWRNAETQLISQRALVSTAGWLIPLHDRIAATLSVAVLVPASDSTTTELASHLTQRLRRSDIAGHFGNTLALLLPSTSAGAAEALLRDLHQNGPGFRASLITLADATQALEPVLTQLEKSLERSREDTEHWLVHAPQLR